MLIAPWEPKDLIAPIGRAIESDRVTALAGTLARLDEAGAFDDPALYDEPQADRYARRLLWRDPAGRFVVIAMTWAGGQGSPLHDHAGLWGAEIVVEGTMREAGYRLAGRDGDRFRFVPDYVKTARKGDVGVVLPPFEYHEFGNAGDETARTIHVYCGDVERCRSFVAGDTGYWRAQSLALHYDA